MFSKNRVFVIFLFFGLIILASSCKVQPVELKGIEGVDIKGIQGNSVTIQVSATLSNPNPRLKIKSSELMLSVGEMQIGKITQLEKIVLKGNSTETYTTRVKFELSGSKFNMLSVYKLFERNKKDFKVSGKVKIAAPLYSKTINFSDYQVFN